MRFLLKSLLTTVVFSTLSIISTAHGAEVSSTEIKADASKGEAIYTKGLSNKGIPACISCHGANGNSGGGANPKLAGQHEQYIFKQLKDFKAKKERSNPIMSVYASNMNEQEMRDVATYLNKQKIKAGSAKTFEAIELGKKIYRAGIASKAVPACTACHSPNGAGIPAQYPRVGGQWSDYTKAQMLAFKNGSRKNGAKMVEIASRMSDKEIEAVSDYIAGLH
jgi:cytochrome c553